MYLYITIYIKHNIVNYLFKNFLCNELLKPYINLSFDNFINLIFFAE